MFSTGSGQTVSFSGAVIGWPHRFDFVPILNVHTGCPFSRLDQNWNFIGAEYNAGRLPVLLVLTRSSSTPLTSSFVVTGFSSVVGQRFTTCSTT